MKDLLIATNNPGKIKEFRELLPHFNIKSLADFPEIDDIVEDGRTFAENAIKKAVTLAEHTGCWTLADDSGLVVDALGGAPGVFSARYAGENGNSARNIEKLLREMAAVPQEKRQAHFTCVIALAHSETEVLTVEGHTEGEILSEKHGGGGFGYDPVFFSRELSKTFAEAAPEEKNRVSHRGRAIRKIIPEIEKLLA